MRLFNDKIIFSAGDLIGFLGCKYATILDYKAAMGEQVRPTVEEDMQVIIDAGLKHEEDYLQKLKDEGKEVYELPLDSNFIGRCGLTKEAMVGGKEVIYQAEFYSDSWHGIADFLVKVDKPSELGSYSYIPYDTKLKKTPTAEHFIQLGVYAGLVAKVQGLLPSEVLVVLGDGTQANCSPQRVIYYLNEAKSRLEKFVKALPEDMEPEPCGFCSSCSWSDVCGKIWEEKDHLSLVANIRRSQIKKLEAAGIDTLEKLAVADEERKIAKLSAAAFQKIRKQAALQFEKRRTNKSRVELLEVEEGRGFNRLPEANEGDLFFDMEGDPLYPDGLEYLFGVYYRCGGAGFKAFWGHDRAGERRAFEELMEFFAGHLAKYPDAHIYHYNHYEETALKRLSSGFGAKEEELDDLLRGGRFVDLYKVVREGLMTTESGYSIKDLEAFYMEAREGDVQSATQSIVFYERWRATGDEALLQQIEEYNYDDCVSTALCLDWLLGLRPEGAEWFKVAPVEVKPEVLEQRAQEAKWQEALRGLAPVEGHATGELVSYLCDFHRRAKKPIWWKIFSLQGAADEELEDELDCLAGLRMEGEQEVEKRSFVASYRYRPQETRLGEGDRPFIASTGEPAGLIEYLDRDRGEIVLKRGMARGDLPVSLSLLPPMPIDDRKLREAIKHCAMSYLIEAEIFGEGHETNIKVDLSELDGRYGAIKEFLLRRPTRLEEPGLLEACGQGALEASQLLKVVLAMQETVMFIQGPPGCGKTYNGGRVIVGLLAAGKKVAVSSNSHKAIINLLKGVEKAAEEAGISFSGVKKSNFNREDTLIGGKFIRDIESLAELTKEDALIAGTAWLMAEPSLLGHCDYLFVDEAGQVALANLVAMSGIASNIVLLGDQMQLGQPIQGVHPGDSGTSALEYLLQDKPVVAADYGVFLDTTWRLHPNISDFISEAVYDGRLKAHEANGAQQLLLQPDHHKALKPCGIKFWAVEHLDCAQKCEAEGAEILAIYTDLLRHGYRNRQGLEQALTPEDIVVISPYNAQVNYLKTILPEDIRIGTVDKFQGQEAQVVLISMTTSSQEDLPRNIEFLFSSNRLNVAVSRAKCLAIVLASPLLLEVSCSTLEQLSLVNTLCHLKAWAEK